MAGETFLFYVFAAVSVGASLLVIGRSNPIHSVLLLIAAFGGLSGLYVLLDAPFVAVIQIIIYAGAIMVVFLFAVMLLNAPREDVPGAPVPLVGRGARAYTLWANPDTGQDVAWAEGVFNTQLVAAP